MVEVAKSQLGNVGGEPYQRMKAYLKRHDMRQKDFIDLVLRRALVKNWHNVKARELKTYLLRRLGRMDDALAQAEGQSAP